MVNITNWHAASSIGQEILIFGCVAIKHFHALPNFNALTRRHFGGKRRD
jgi:hypothetical protein